MWSTFRSVDFCCKVALINFAEVKIDMTWKIYQMCVFSGWRFAKCCWQWPAYSVDECHRGRSPGGHEDPHPRGGRRASQGQILIINGVGLSLYHLFRYLSFWFNRFIAACHTSGNRQVSFLGLISQFTSVKLNWLFGVVSSKHIISSGLQYLHCFCSGDIQFLFWAIPVVKFLFTATVIMPKIMALCQTVDQPLYEPMMLAQCKTRMSSIYL